MTDNYHIKIIEIEPGVEISLDRQMPYGFIYLTLNTGNLPEEYQGAYTTTEAATQAVNLYKEDRRKALLEISSSTSGKKAKQA